MAEIRAGVPKGHLLFLIQEGFLMHIYRIIGRISQIHRQEKRIVLKLKIKEGDTWSGWQTDSQPLWYQPG